MGSFVQFVILGEDLLQLFLWEMCAVKVVWLRPDLITVCFARQKTKSNTDNAVLGQTVAPLLVCNLQNGSKWD